ncbi:MAG TPA: hypothetical protein HA257_06420 [Candidatus Methanoperedenaceae archaeon]|nr:hypothetical protein [Candidatus Methanoperedenaceae archaeon]
MTDWASLRVQFDLVYPFLSFIGFAGATFAAYLTRKMYYVTKGASYYWMFLSAFSASIAVFSFLEFLRLTFLIQYNVELLAAQVVALVAAGSFGLVAAILVSKLFEEMGK